MCREDQHERSLREMIGRADCLELLSRVFSFPSIKLSEALVNGTLASDIKECLVDAGVAMDVAEGYRAKLSLAPATQKAELFEELRCVYTALYLAPGSNVPVFPYEAAFLFKLEAREGSPTLFRAPRTLDVEKQMREAGVMPIDARREPSDSVWNELSFLSFLHGSVAAAMHERNGGAVKLWRERISRFWEEHGSCWLPAFMEQTCVMAPDATGGGLYARFAEIGQIVLGVIAEGANAPIELVEA